MSLSVTAVWALQLSLTAVIGSYRQQKISAFSHVTVTFSHLYSTFMFCWAEMHNMSKSLCTKPRVGVLEQG